MQFHRTPPVRFCPAATLLISSVLLGASVHASPGEWQQGDVFLDFIGGDYKVYGNDGVFKESLPSFFDFVEYGTSSAFAGPGDDLYLALAGKSFAVFGTSNVVSLDEAHPHSTNHFYVLSYDNVQDMTSIVFDAAGNFYIGSNSLAGAGDIHKYNAAGDHVDAYDVGLGSPAAPYSMELAPDQRTLFFVSGQASTVAIKRFDLVTETLLADFYSTSAPNAGIGNFRLLPPFDGSGGLIVVRGASIHRMDASGATIQTYDQPSTRWNRLNLDPNGTSFWSCGKPDSSGPIKLYRFNIQTGAVEVGPANLGAGTLSVWDMVVRGEPLGGSTPAQFDAPTPCETTVMATAGVPVSFTVQASDINAGDIVNVSASGLPSGATLTPGLPSSGNPVSVTFDWTPSGTQVGTHLITFTATDFVGHETLCTATVTVEGPGTAYCFGDGLDPVVTAMCPCTNFGDPGHGCANSIFASGAQLSATGTTSPNTVLLVMTNVPNNTLATGFRNLTNTNPGGVVFGDGVRCQSGALIRFSSHNTGTLGDAPNTWSSPTDTIAPGLTRYYQVQYRNPAPAFCPPATFNISNGYRIDW